MVSNIVDSTKISTVDEKLLTENKEKSNSIKQQHLDKLKTKTYTIYTVVAILATALGSIYSYFAVMLVKDAYKQNRDDYYKEFEKIDMLRWINGAIFTVG